MASDLVKQEAGSTALVYVPRPCFYRYQEVLYSHSRLQLVLQEYLIVKRTEKGTWINVFGVSKFILASARKRYASPTRAEALESYHARKSKQVGILEKQLARAKAALTLTPDADVGWFALQEGDWE